MSSLSAAFLGLLQGLTEFLPVSSSGHLVLFQQFMELHGDEVFFDLVLHLGTLLPVVWFYRDSLREILVDGARGRAIVPSGASPERVPAPGSSCPPRPWRTGRLVRASRLPSRGSV